MVKFKVQIQYQNKFGLTRLKIMLAIILDLHRSYQYQGGQTINHTLTVICSLGT